MSKKKDSNRMVWYVVGGLALFAILWLATSPNTPAKAPKKVVARRLPASSADDQFTEEDYKARFPVLTTASTVKDTFKPLVYRKDVAARSGVSLLNAIPADFAEGDGSWIYTGTAETDGVPEALFENKTSGEGIFLQHGAHWKRAVVEQITPTTVLLSGPSGTKLLQLVDPEPTEDKTATTTTTVTSTPDTTTITAGADAGTTPVSPQVIVPMSGPIGGGGYGGGGGRGRRGRRGGGFGGGNNGGGQAATTGGG
jgi:hypothetical protein